MVGEQGDILRAALAQRRHEEHLEAQPVEQVGLELSCFRHRAQVGVGRGDEAHVHGDGFARAHPLETAVLDHAQDFLLHRHRHLADFVEKQRAAVRRLEPPRPPPRRAGERPRLVAEEFALQHGRREGRAVQLDEWPAPTRGQEVNALGSEFLAGTAFADEQDRPLDLGDAGELLLEIEEEVRFTQALRALPVGRLLRTGGMSGVVGNFHQTLVLHAKSRSCNPRNSRFI